MPTPKDTAPAGTPKTAAELAALCGGQTGDQLGGQFGDQRGGQTTGNAVLTHVSSPERALPGALVFAEDEKSLAAALASKAGAILFKADAQKADASEVFDPRLILVADPRLSFARCARALQPVRTSSEIHPTAIVDPSARVGLCASIGPGAVIEAGAVIGDEVTIGARACVGRSVRIGSRVIVQAGAVLGSTGFGYVRDAQSGDYVLFPQQGDLIVEDDVEVGANTTIDRGALGETRIGRGTKIDNLVHIGHNCRIGRNVVIAAQAGVSGSTVIEDGAILAGQVGLSDHCHIGPGVILGGQAGVYRGKSVEGPGQVFAGTPAEPLKEHMRSLAKLRRLK